MEPDEIRAKRIEIVKRLRFHDGARKAVEAELLALQHVCEHPNAKWTEGTCCGKPDSSWDCPDCGLSKG